MANKPVRKQVLLKSALVLASLIVSIGLFDAGLRLVGYDLNFSPLWKYHPTYGWTVDPDVSTMDEVNADGFRYRLVPQRKSPHTRRVLVLGDSFLQATAVPYAASFPGVMEASLNQNQATERWEVVSLGVGDWGSAQQLIALAEHGLAFGPDVVVVQVFPFNDLCNNTLGIAETCSLQDYHRPYLVLEGGELRRTYLSEWRAWSRRTLVSFGMVENALGLSRQVGLSKRATDFRDVRRKRNEFFLENARRKGLEYPGAISALIPDAEQPPPIREGWITSERIVQEMAGILAAREIPVVALIVPFESTLPPKWEAFRRSYRKQTLVADYGTRRFEGMFESIGVPTISVRNRILESGTPTQDFFLANDSHLSTYGHYQVATWILEALKAQGLPEDALPVVLEGETRLQTRRPR